MNLSEKYLFTHETTGEIIHYGLTESSLGLMLNVLIISQLSGRMVRIEDELLVQDEEDLVRYLEALGWWGTAQSK